jgi:non-ribosomal peptide synthetase component F
LENGRLSAQIEYWRKQLPGLLSRPYFRKAWKRKKGLSLRAIRRPLDLGQELFAVIKTVARRKNCTPFMVVVTVLSTVIREWSGEEDIRIGTLLANRSQGKAEDVIGHFVNTVVLRIQVSPKMSFGELLSQVRQATLAAHINENVPFEYLAKTLEQEQKAERHSRVPVLVSYQMSNFERLERTGLAFAGLDIEQIETVDRAAPTAFDLIFKLRESSTNLTGTVNYVDDRFATGDVVPIVDRFDFAVRSIVADVDYALSTSLEDVLGRVS